MRCSAMGTDFLLNLMAERMIVMESKQELQATIEELEQRLEQIKVGVLGLVRDFVIAPELAMEILGMNRDAFDKLLQKHQIATVTYDPAEVEEEMAVLDALEKAAPEV